MPVLSIDAIIAPFADTSDFIENVLSRLTSCVVLRDILEHFVAVFVWLLRHSMTTGSETQAEQPRTD